MKTLFFCGHHKKFWVQLLHSRYYETVSDVSNKEDRLSSSEKALILIGWEYSRILKRHLMQVIFGKDKVIIQNKGLWTK